MTLRRSGDVMMETGCVRIEFDYFEPAKNAFLSEGLDENVPQVWKPGQRWGGAKLLDKNNEMHVRIIERYDGFGRFLIVDSEIEVPRDYLEHLSQEFKAQPYYGPVLDILRRYGIPHSNVGFLQPDPVVVNRPTQPTPWKPLLGVVIVLAAIGFFGSFFD